MSQQQLATRMTDLGYEVSQPVIGRMESDEGRNISIADLFAVSIALDVAPIELLSASFAPEDVPIVGEVKAPPRATLDWIRGEIPLVDIVNEELFFDSVASDRKKALRQIRGLWVLRGLLNDYEESSMRDDVEVAENALTVLIDEAQMQKRQLEQNPALWTADRQRRRARRQTTDGKETGDAS
jgi:transcriptional regulator with XRE-family HTH domain